MFVAIVDGKGRVIARRETVTRAQQAIALLARYNPARGPYSIERDTARLAIPTRTIKRSLDRTVGPWGARMPIHHGQTPR